MTGVPATIQQRVIHSTIKCEHNIIIVFVKRKEQHFLIENDSTQWV
jgi:hypothetical protein